MSTETPEAAARRAELRAGIVEGLALVAEHTARIRDTRAELAGQGRTGLFDPDMVYHKAFGRAVEDLAYAAQVADRLNPIRDDQGYVS